MSFQLRKYASSYKPSQSKNTPQSNNNSDNHLFHPLATTFHEKPQWILVFPTSTDKKIISSGNIPVSSKSQLASDNLITSLSPQTTTPPSPSTV
ncbi:MAG: hypothetical protein N3D76_13010, partial [Geminocystis sp.]|nr:hypothetical protein [Geminocystis sp.]